jgi:LmbE family N-acetylglucosaminyl deacetylase
MLGLLIESPPGRVLRVLCIGAHCDDLEIGCGGTLLALQASQRRVTIDYALLSGTAERRREAASAMRNIVKPPNRGELLHAEFTDGRFPAEYGAIKDWFEALKRRPRPDVIFCHERGDRHQDHRIVNEMVWNTFRDHLVLEYETPKWDGGLGEPNVYVPLTSLQAKRKADVLLKSYPSQRGRDWFTRDTFLALLRLRGVECRSSSGYAEAFHGRKLQLTTA